MRKLNKKLFTLLLCAGITVNASACLDEYDDNYHAESTDAITVKTSDNDSEGDSINTSVYLDVHVNSYYTDSAESTTISISNNNLQEDSIEFTTIETSSITEKKLTYTIFSLSDVPSYSGSAYTIINDNIPYYNETDLTITSFEYYSDLDELGRCRAAYACIGKDIMPTEERGSIGNVKPTGWHTIKYDNIDGKYLYNRCHLIGYQLSGENVNEKNLITGTRYLNVEDMLPFENMTADYVNETENHVLYRVTPIFDDDNLLATGVLMEGYSVEDNGDGICFNVFCYNVQPDITINYINGESKMSVVATTTTAMTTSPVTTATTTTPQTTTTIYYRVSRYNIYYKYKHKEISLSVLFKCKTNQRVKQIGILGRSRNHYITRLFTM